jgi:MFS transporter, DHA1 family, multidrug resistance protein
VEVWQRNLYILIFAQLVTAVGFSMVFPFLPLYVEDLGSQANLSIELLAGLVFSAQALTMMVASPIWGAIADKYGRKRMVERAMFGGAIIILLMGFARSAEELVLLRALQGMITGTVAAANALVAASAPRERIGYAMGLLQVGTWSGVAIGPILGGVVADTLGFRAAFIVTSALLLISGVIVWLGVSERFKRPTESKRPSLLSKWREIITAPGVGTVFGLRFSVWLGRLMIVPIAPLFVATLLIDSERVGTVTGLVVGLAAATGTASAVYLGRLGDRVGHRKILVTCSLAAALFYLPQTFVANVWQLLVLQALSGAAVGGILPALSALLNHYTKRGEAGAVYGLDNSMVSGARAVAPLIGAAIAMLFGLRGTFAFAALVFLLTTLFMWRLPEPARDETGARRVPGD